jgi:hypothetical protein
MRDQVRQVVEYAMAERNHYCIQPNGRSDKKHPSNNPNHVAQVHQYRNVFSITITNGQAWRHLEVSVTEKGQFAAPIVALTLAQIFGFTGWDGVTPKPPQHWGGMLDKENNCVHLFQEFKGN